MTGPDESQNTRAVCAALERLGGLTLEAGKLLPPAQELAAKHYRADNLAAFGSNDDAHVDMMFRALQGTVRSVSEPV